MQKLWLYMDDAYRIYVEQLRGGQEKKISEKLPPSFLDVDEPDLAFEKDIEVEGVAYLAEQDLIINWNILAEALIPCSICNEQVPIEIRLENVYHAEPLANIKTGIFNFKDILRESILLEIPPFTECNQGKCPKRKEIKKYLKQANSEFDEDEGYHPFADLDWK